MKQRLVYAVYVGKKFALFDFVRIIQIKFISQSDKSFNIASSVQNVGWEKQQVLHLRSK